VPKYQYKLFIADVRLRPREIIKQVFDEVGVSGQSCHMICR